jgi:hypothetical protein
MSRIENASNTDPRPQMKVAPAPAVEPQPKMGGDKLVRHKQAVGNKEVDKFTDGLGAQGFVQDTTRSVATWLSSVGRESRLANAMMGFFAGDAEEVNRGVTVAATRMGKVASAAKLGRVAQASSPVATAAKAALRFVGKAGPLISIPFAGYDVAKAWTEPDATKKDAAWMNASLTVGGTALGLAALAFPPAAIPLLIGSAGVALLQLGDTYAFKGKVMDFLGAHVAHPIRHLFGRT